jgi:putative ABC transport system permease protein
MIAHDRARFAITVGGIAVATGLLFFLLALHDGIRRESNGWVHDRPADLWVAQENSDNFIKSSSTIPLALVDSVRAVEGVAEATPLLRFISVLDVAGDRANAIVVALDPASTLGTPTVDRGTARLRPGELLLDRALAARHGVRVGDTVRLLRTPFRVVGTTTGTNAVLVQLAFVTLADAEALLGQRGVASYLLVRAARGTTAERLATRLRARVPRVTVLRQGEFSDANVRELRGGLVPILATVAVLGAIVAATVLALLLQGAVLEHRETWALLKALGAPDAALARIVLAQAAVAVGGGFVAGLVGYALLSPIARWAVPEIVLALPPAGVAWTAIGAVVVALAASLVPLRRVQRLHPAELFRA